MAKQHPNAQDRVHPFLSNIGGAGHIEVDAPNGVMNGTIEGSDSWAEHAPRQTRQYGGPIKIWGSRSGRGKTLTVK